jgi:hypothetical protein
MERPSSPRSISRRWLPAALLLLAVGAAALPAWLASRVEPPGNDLALHGMMVEGAADTLRAHGWNAFQDPWFAHPNGGYAIFHAYPHLPHQVLAVVSVVTGVDPWLALGAGNLVLVLLLPLLVYAGGRVLGLRPLPAAFAALIGATLRSGDAYGHGTLSYGFESLGMVGQLWGMALACVALPTWVAASTADGAGLARLSRAARVALAGVLVGLLIRTHLPSAWVVVLTAGTCVVAAGPLRQIPARVARYGVVGLVAALLASGFLVGFVADLDALVVVDLEHEWKLRSVGAVTVIGRLLCGEYLDGLAHAPWTPALLVSAGWLGWRWATRREGSVSHGLLLAVVVAVLLLFGRHTWGDWITSLPVVGRFHDHRYLLGLQLLAPWLTAAGLFGLGAAVRGPLHRARVPLAVGVVLLAIVVHAMASWIDLAAWRRNTAQFEAFAAVAQPLVARATQEPGRVALGMPDPQVGGTTLLWWLRRNGVDTAGAPMHHYATSRDFALFWQQWVTGKAQMRQRPLTMHDLEPLGVSRLVVPAAAALDPAGHGWPEELERVDCGAWAILQRPGREPALDDLSLVRSDLLIRGDGLRLQGLTLAWFLLGLHQDVQHPTIDVGVGAPSEADGYLREVPLAAEDPQLLMGLPPSEPGSLGRIEAVETGARPRERVVTVDVASPGVWLRQVRSWHPQWRAAIDGEPASVHLLIPGHVGVQLPPGRHAVTTWWQVPTWRGPWALLNVLVHLLVGAWLVWRGVRRPDQAV